MATKLESVYDDDSDSERGFMLRQGSRSTGPAHKTWSWQCQGIAYGVLVLLMALNLMGGGGDGPLSGLGGGGPTPQRKIVAIGGGQAADKPWIRDTIIGMTGKTTPTVLYIGTPGFDLLSGYERQAVRFQGNFSLSFGGLPLSLGC